MTDSIALENDAAAIAGAIMGSSVLARNPNLSPRSAGRMPRPLPNEPRNPHARGTTFDMSPSKFRTDFSTTTIAKNAIDSSPSKQMSSLDDEDVDELDPLEDLNPDSWLEAANNDPSAASFARNSAAYRTFIKQARHKQTVQASVAPSASTPSYAPPASANTKPSEGETSVAEVTPRILDVNFTILARFFA